MVSSRGSARWRVADLWLCVSVCIPRLLLFIVFQLEANSLYSEDTTQMRSPFGKVRVALVFLFVMLAVNFLAAQRVRDEAEDALHSVPDGKGGADSEHALPEARPVGQSVSQGHGINYHGGPVMKGTPNIYLIWYGNWTTGPKASDRQTTVNLVDAFLDGLNGSGYMRINSTYGDNSGNVTGNIHRSTQIFDTGSQGTTFNDTGLRNIVSAA